MARCDLVLKKAGWLLFSVCLILWTLNMLAFIGTTHTANGPISLMAPDPNVTAAQQLLRRRQFFWELSLMFVNMALFGLAWMMMWHEDLLKKMLARRWGRS